MSETQGKPREKPREGSRGLALGVALFAAAILARLPGLGRSLFYDELFTTRYFTDSLAHAVFSQKQANNHPLCSLLAWAFSTLVGRDDALALRVPSVFVGALAVVATAWLAGRRSTRAVAALAGAFALVHPAHVGFSQEVRGYALVLLFAPLAVRLALDVLEGERRFVGMLAACVALGLWAHATFGVVVVGLAGYLLFCKGAASADRRRALAGVGGGLAFGAVLLAPTLSHLGKFAASNTSLGDAAGGFPTLERLGAVGEMLTVGDARLGPFWLLAVGVGTLAVVGNVASIRAGDRVGSAIDCVFGATAIVWVVARPLFYARFFAFLLPLVLVLAARGAGEVAARILRGSKKTSVRFSISAKGPAEGELPWNKKRTLVFFVGGPLVLAWALATGERAGWETQPTKPAVEFAVGRGAKWIGPVGLGSNLVHVDGGTMQTWLRAQQTWVRAQDLETFVGAPRTMTATDVGACLELFPERHDVAALSELRVLKGAEDLEEFETRDFPGLYSNVRVHLLRGRQH